MGMNVKPRVWWSPSNPGQNTTTASAVFTSCPDVVWIGSANWTNKADRFNTEAAVAIADRSFVHAATKQIAGIISRSEPLSSYSATPAPNLAPTRLGSAACADYAAEFYMGR
jgi:hypothetical protein